MWQLIFCLKQSTIHAHAPFLVTDSEALADAVENEIERQLKLLPREAIARPSVENNGRIIIANDTDAMFELMNLVAPEHLEIAMDNAYDYLEKVENCWFRLSWSLY